MSISQCTLTRRLMVFLFATSLPAYADVVVVASLKSTVSSLTEEQASNVFLGKINSLPGSGKVIPLDQPNGSSIKDLFYQKITGKTAAQLKAYWSQQIFTGKGWPPKEVGDDTVVRNLVASNPSTVGYIDKSAVDSTVKVLLSIK